MSNTWEYRFAFRINGPADVPSEFRNAYKCLMTSDGSPFFSLFTPAMEQSGIIATRWLPPKVILVFQNFLAVLSLQNRSSQIATFRISLEDFLGCGLGSFLLNSWLALYPGYPSEDKLQIKFPPQAFRHYQDLLRFLLCWPQDAAEFVTGCRRDVCQSLAGLPPKFSAFLADYPELGRASEFFFQPAMELHTDRSGGWANLLLAVSPHGIVALSDQYHDHASEYGIEMTFFPLRCVKSVDWIEPAAGKHAVIQIDLQGAERALRLSWSVFRGLRPYALRWISEVEFFLTMVKRNQACTGTISATGVQSNAPLGTFSENDGTPLH